MNCITVGSKHNEHCGFLVKSKKYSSFTSAKREITEKGKKDCLDYMQKFSYYKLIKHKIWLYDLSKITALSKHNQQCRFLKNPLKNAVTVFKKYLQN